MVTQATVKREPSWRSFCYKGYHITFILTLTLTHPSEVKPSLQPTKSRARAGVIPLVLRVC